MCVVAEDLKVQIPGQNCAVVWFVLFRGLITTQLSEREKKLLPTSQLIDDGVDSASKELQVRTHSGTRRLSFPDVKCTEARSSAL